MVITAGEGSNTQTSDGGDGGRVQICGGAGQGGRAQTDHGGNVEIAGGYAKSGRGGSFWLRTGYGAATSSGLIDISTANAGKPGVVSGEISIYTGTSSLGNTGFIALTTGEATKGKGGHPCHGGRGRYTDRRRGRRRGRQDYGQLHGRPDPHDHGLQLQDDVGTFTIDTANAGPTVPPAAHLDTGTTSKGNSGMITFVTGRANEDTVATSVALSEPATRATVVMSSSGRRNRRGGDDRW